MKCLTCGRMHVMRLIDFNKRTYDKCRCDHFNGKTIKDRRLNGIFWNMVSRCTNPQAKDFRFYGAKGICVCEQWIEDPREFEIWAINNGYNKNLSIDRIDHDGDYCPENCRWISMEDNSRYKSTTHLIEIDGISKTGRQWSESIGFGINTINMLCRKYDEIYVKALIQKALMFRPNIDVFRIGNQSWMDAYGIQP